MSQLELDIPTEVAAVETWLESNGYEIGLLCIEQDSYKIGAIHEQDGHEFELNIECSYFQGIVMLTVQCTDEINPDRYLFLLQLLNYMNANEELAKFTLNPSTMKLCCTSVIGLYSEIHDSDEIPYRLGIYNACAMADMTKVINILRENVGLKEAVRRMIGDIPVIKEQFRKQ